MMSIKKQDFFKFVLLFLVSCLLLFICDKVLSFDVVYKPYCASFVSIAINDEAIAANEIELVDASGSVVGCIVADDLVLSNDGYDIFTIRYDRNQKIAMVAAGGKATIPILLILRNGELFECYYGERIDGVFVGDSAIDFNFDGVIDVYSTRKTNLVFWKNQWYGAKISDTDGAKVYSIQLNDGTCSSLIVREGKFVEKTE